MHPVCRAIHCVEVRVLDLLLYDTLPQRPGLLRMADAVVITLFLHFPPLKSHRGQYLPFLPRTAGNTASSTNNDINRQLMLLRSQQQEVPSSPLMSYYYYK